MTDKLQLAEALIDKYNELVELYWPWVDVKSPVEQKLISVTEGDIASLKIQFDSIK